MGQPVTPCRCCASTLRYVKWEVDSLHSRSVVRQSRPFSAWRVLQELTLLELPFLKIQNGVTFGRTGKSPSTKVDPGLYSHYCRNDSDTMERVTFTRPNKWQFTSPILASQCGLQCQPFNANSDQTEVIYVPR